MEDVSSPISRSPFVGREPDLAVATEMLDEAASGVAGMLLLGGDAGMGKTRILEEIDARATAGGFTVLAGRCIDLGEVSLPFAPIADAVRGLRRAQADAIAEAFGPGGEDLARLLPGTDAGRAAGDTPNPGQVFEAVLGLIEGVAESGPVLVSIEDAQWADQATRDLLSFLARALPSVPVLIVVTYRCDDLTRRHPLRGVLNDLERLAHVRRHELEPLGRNDIATIVAAGLGVDVDPSVVESVWRRSEGNPFHAEELMLAEACCDRVPASVRDAMLARVNRLGEEHQALLRLAAALGREVDDTVLAELSGLSRDDFHRIVRDLVADALLVPEDTGYHFRHALLQEAVYEELLPGERVALHRRIAAHLVPDGDAPTDPEVAGTVAHHWLRARCLPEALTASVDAGLAADAVGAPADALAHYERALEVWDSVPDAAERSRLSWFEILEHAEPAATLAGRVDRALDLARAMVAAADPETDPRRAAVAHMRLGRTLFVAYRPGAVEELERATELVPATEVCAERAQVLAAHAQTLMLLGRFDEAVPVGREGLEVALAVGDRNIEGHLRNTLGVMLVNQGEVDEGLAELWTAYELAQTPTSVRDLQDVGRAYVNLSVSLSGLGRWDEALALVEEGQRVTQRYGLDRSEGVCLASNGVEVLVAKGRWDEAAAAAQAVVEWVPLGSWGYQDMSTVLADRGDFVAAHRAIDQAEPLQASQTAALVDLPALATAQVALAVWERRPADARPLVEAHLSRVPPHLAVWHSDELVWRATWAEAEVALLAVSRSDGEELAAARAAAERMVALGHHVLDPGPDRTQVRPTVCFAGYLALAECEVARIDGTDSTDDWLGAGGHFDDLGVVFPAAYARLRAAEAAVRDGHREAATPLLVEVLATAAQLGAQPLRELAEQLATRARLDVGAVPVTDDGTPDDGLGLSARERQVLALVAAGRTNRQIGEELYISPKTASVHVSNILAKLGVASRVEAAGVAHRLGLQPA
ncbi:MAG: helix-turn-helix transcriptional regulator [Acidimicrobiales bacterium]